MPTRLVILDFDGTLADTQPLIVRSIQLTLAELHLPYRTPAQCRAIIGLPLQECFLRLLPIDEGMASRCADVYRRIFDEENQPGVVTLFPKVLETLLKLHVSGLQLAICSSRGKPTLEAFVDHFSLRDIVAMTVSANDVTRAKPHPDPVLLILDRLAVAPAETVVVGDTSFDIQMGKSAGCRTVGVTYGNQSAAALSEAGADHLIDTFADLIHSL